MTKGRPIITPIRLTKHGDIAHNGAMKRMSPTRAVNIRCGIIITS
jgi:hypothetical protein